MKKEKIIYSVVFTLCIIGYFATDISYAGLVGIAMIFYAGLALALVGGSTDKVKITLSGEKEGRKGMEAKLCLTVENKGMMPIVNGRCNLEAVNKLTGEEATLSKNLSLMPKSSSTIDFSILPQYCGCVEVSAYEVIISDPLGIFQRKQSLHEETSCYVFPSMNQLPLDSDSLDRYNMESYKYSANQKGSDISETFGIKDYMPGDSPKAIHWKLSCKMDDMVVRELSHPVENSLMIICDKSLSHGQQLSEATKDKMTELFVSLSATAIKHELHHAIGWYNYEIEQFQVFRIDNLDDIYNALPGLLGSPYREDPLSTVGRYVESDAEKNFSTYLYFSESENAENDTERLLNYGQVEIYRTENFE